MRHLTNFTLIATAILATTCVAAADSNSVGVTITSDRDPDNLTVPKDMKYELNGAHTFDVGLILGGSFQYTDTTFSDKASQNLEGTIGYRVPLNSVLSVNGSAGIGEHWKQSPSTYFSYYVLRIATDFELNQNITWNVISYRFRDAFDHDNNYDTPQVAQARRAELDLGENYVQLERWPTEQYGRLTGVQAKILIIRVRLR
jgi:hypothetical protein